MSRYVRAENGAARTDGQLLRHEADPNRWLVRAFIGRDAKGRKRYSSQVVRGRKRDAQAALTDMQQRKHSGKLAPKSTATLADLTREWLEHKSREVTARTLEGYRSALHAYVLPTLGHRRLATLTLRDVDQLYGRMMAGSLPPVDEDEPGWKGKPLSARTVRLTHAALSQAFSQAVRWGMIPHNPAAEASIPSHRPREKRALSSAERERFIEACQSSFYGVFYRLLVDTGLRPGEACGLRWGDVDFEHGRIAVQRAVTTGPEGPTLAEPKTTKSRRTVPLLGGLRDVLLAHYQSQAERGLDESGFVVTTMDGRMLAPSNLGKRDLPRVARAAQIPEPEDVTLYSLRHTFATLHVQAGTPLKVVSDLLGHANIQQTANTYQHVSMDVTEDWMRRFEESLAPRDARPAAPVN